MSAQAAPSGTQAPVGDPNTVDPNINPGGSLDEEIEAGDGLEGDIDEPIGVEGGEGSEAPPPEPEAPPAPQPEPQEDPGVAQMREENAYLRQIVDEVRGRMQQDPELAKRLSGPTQPNWREETARTLRASLKPEAAEAVVTALDPVFQRLERLENRYGETERVTQSLAQTIGSTEFVEGLSVNGVTSQVMRTPQFQKHLKEMRKDPEFRRVELSSRKYAGRIAAREWAASRAQGRMNVDDASRVATARTGRGTNPAARGAALTEKVIQVVREPFGGHIDKADALRYAAQKAGRPLPRIEYVNPK